ncbi:MAG TPA: DUF692 family protein [Kofleriaceae bacterium]|nr:DUF692 family protein [Kofleriaceae bacterium]
MSLRPRVGVLYNPTTPALMDHAGALVEHVSVMPDRLWFDFGHEAPRGRRFRRAADAFARLIADAGDRPISGHGLGLSLPSAMPLDEEMVSAVAGVARDLGGFAWHSEHLNLFIAPRSSVPNAQAGLGLPVVYDEESYALIADKLDRVAAALGCPVLLENGSFFTPVPDLDLDEPAFLNRLYREGHGGVLLDLHNLLVSARNDGADPVAYLDALDLDAVVEVHLAGGGVHDGFYMDSHSSFTPPEVWELAARYLPRCRRLRAITFEYQESYFADLGLPGLAAELERIHALADACAEACAGTQRAEVARAG